MEIMQRTRIQERPDVIGWGADLDLANRPAVPMERTPPRLDVPAPSPEPQPLTKEVLVSTEYPEMPPIFGDGPEPSAVSGLLRRGAFVYSENDIRHWLILLFADRVNMIEGLVEDIGSGHVPNIFAEMGWKAKFKYNLPGAIARIAVVSALIGGAAYLALRDTDADDDDSRGRRRR